VTEAEQQVALENGYPISLLYVNEGQELLMKGGQVLSNTQYLQQFKESQLGVARYEALDSLAARAARAELIEVLPLTLKDSFAAIRERGLSLLQAESEWKEVFSGLEAEVYRLAEEDPENKVRSSALEVLTGWNPTAYKGAMMRLARDPSYLVAGAALMGLALLEESRVETSWMESFEGDSNFRIAVALAEYYITTKVPSKGPWFESMLATLRGEGLYYFMGYYGSYFLEVGVEDKEPAIANLFTILEFNSKDYLRLGAFQALLGFATDEGVLARLEEVSAKERSEELQSYYAYYLEMLKEEN
jgi:aminopeptidase N